MTRALRRREIRLHGHPVSYYEAGSGPVVLLVHGITASADAWRSVLPALAEHHTWSRRTGRQRDVRGAALGLASLHDGEARRAFLHTARSIIDPSGQRVSARDRLYLAEGMPTLILWGDRDPMIPAAHGIAAHEAIPHSRLELFPGAGHYPFEEDPERFVAVLREFIGMTEPSSYDEEEIRRRLLAGAPA